MPAYIPGLLLVPAQSSVPEADFRVQRCRGHLTAAGRGKGGGEVASAYWVFMAQGVPPDVARAVVPGICRTALEGCLVDLTRRRLLAVGAGHAEVKEALSSARRLWEPLSLAVKGEIVADTDVQGWLRDKLGKS